MLVPKIVKLGGYLFEYPPFIKRTWRRRGSQQIRVRGHAPSFASLGKLSEVCREGGPIMIDDDGEATEVVINDFRSRGLNYRVLLTEYTPLQMVVDDWQMGKTEDIGRDMFRPRFSVAVSRTYPQRSKTIRSTSFGLSSYSILIEPDKEMSCRFKFEDFVSETKLGFDASIGDAVEVSLGYEGALVPVYSGKISSLNEVLSDSLEVTISSSICEKGPNTPQRFVYHITEENLFGLRVVHGQAGMEKEITTMGLPFLRPGHQIRVWHNHIYLTSQNAFVAQKVLHKFDRDEGFLTTVTLV